MTLNKADLSYLELYKKLHVKSCPICGGKNAFCQCWRKYNQEVTKITAGIPVKFRKYTLKDFTHPELKKQKEVIENYMKSFLENRFNGQCLYLHGTKGTAKTMSATLILMYALKNKYSAYYFESLKSCSDMLKSDWDEGTSNLENILASYDIVAIDNIGKEVITNTNIANSLKSYFSARANNMLPTLFIAPISMSKLVNPTDIDILEYFSENIKEVNFKGFDYTKAVLTKVKK